MEYTDIRNTNTEVVEEDAKQEDVDASRRWRAYSTDSVMEYTDIRNTNAEGEEDAQQEDEDVEFVSVSNTFEDGGTSDTDMEGEEDTQQEVERYRKAAVQGRAVAQTQLGVCYENGIGVEKNAREAVKWYGKAAAQGNDHAQYHLALCYQNGIGVEKDAKKAAEWYSKAAERGHDLAQRICRAFLKKREKNTRASVEARADYFPNPVPSFNSSSLSLHTSNQSVNTVESKRGLENKNEPTPSSGTTNIPIRKLSRGSSPSS